MGSVGGRPTFRPNSSSVFNGGASSSPTPPSFAVSSLGTARSNEPAAGVPSAERPNGPAPALFSSSVSRANAAAPTVSSRILLCFSESSVNDVRRGSFSSAVDSKLVWMKILWNLRSLRCFRFSETRAPGVSSLEFVGSRSCPVARGSPPAEPSSSSWCPRVSSSSEDLRASVVSAVTEGPVPQGSSPSPHGHAEVAGQWAVWHHQQTWAMLQGSCTHFSFLQKAKQTGRS